MLELAQRAPGVLVQPRVLDRLGDERGDVDQERGVLGREDARRLGVERDHADHAIALEDERHRDERLVLLLLELREVLHPRIRQHVLVDEHRLAVLEHPPGDPLAGAHRDATAEVGVALRRGAQHDPPAALLGEEDVRRVRDDRVVDEPDDRCEHRLDVERRGHGVDDLVEHRELIGPSALDRLAVVGVWNGHHQAAGYAGEGCSDRFTVRDGHRTPAERGGIRAHCTPEHGQRWRDRLLPRTMCDPTIRVRALCLGAARVRPARPGSAERGGTASGDRSRTLRLGRWPRGADRRGAPEDRRVRRHVRLLPVPLGHRADHGQGRARGPLGVDRAQGLPARLRRDRQPLRRPPRRVHRVRPRVGRARRPARAGDLPGAPVGLEGRARVVHLLPRARGPRGRRRVPHLRLPRQPPADPGGSSSPRWACTSAPAPSPR